MIASGVLAVLAFIGFALLLWQWIAAIRFPLHRRMDTPERSAFAPPVTLLKPLKGCDQETERCLRSWLSQEYPGNVQIVFGVASPDDPVNDVVHRLIREFPARDAELVVCSNLDGLNFKVAKLAQMERRAKFDVIVISDADVHVPPDFLRNTVFPLADERVGLVNCFYRLANPSTLAMYWEAVAINADFWSQVLQSKSLKPIDFALGAAMITRRRELAAIGGFQALANCLADDYQLGNRIVRSGKRIELASVVVECRDAPMGFVAVWKHQLRWARTIRVCQPVPYFFSILSNAGFWAIAWLAFELFRIAAQVPAANPCGAWIAAGLLAGRILIALDLQRRIERSGSVAKYFWMIPIKDILQVWIWICAFAGSRVEWRGRKVRLRPDGTLE